MLKLGLLLVVCAACTKATGRDTPSPTPTPVETPAVAPPPVTVTPPAPAPVTVEMTSATLADDCGGAPPARRPAVRADADVPAHMGTGTETDKSAKAKAKGARGYAKGDRACEQTSMQLAITSTAGADATSMQVKKVELFDETGKLVGELTAHAPVLWSDGAGRYQPWDSKVAPAQQLSVSYALSAPNWGMVADRWNKAYVLKAVLAVGATDQTVQRTVSVSAPAMLPPNVKT